MGFRLRQIDYTADGRRIARDREVAGDTLAIGRAGENDLHLPDLAVEPWHATLTAAGRRITVRAVGDRGFALDGRQVTEAVIDADAGAELRFGSTPVTISREADGMVLVEIEGAAQVRPDPADDKAGFALAAVMPGKRPLAWALFALILAVFLVLPIASHLTLAQDGTRVRAANATGHVIGDKAWNPGALSLAHHMLSNRCEACHVKPFQPVSSETCVACHRDVHDHAPAGRLAEARAPAGLGARVLQGVGHAFGHEGPGACIDCHVEHQGMKAMEAPRQQFCADCHAGLKDRLADTKLGDAADFGTLHPEFRASVVTNAETRQRSLVSLADHPHEDSGLTFSHRAHLDRMGGVARMAIDLGEARGLGHALDCADCHQRSPDGVGFRPIDMERDCEACHSLVFARVGGTFLKLRHGDVAQMEAQLSNMATPVTPLDDTRGRPGDFGASYANGGLYHARFTPGGAVARAMAPDGICGECHKPEMRGGKLAVRPVTQTARYLPDGWFDHEAHRQTRCAECHAAANSASASDVLLPRLAECRSCHLGEAASKPKIPSTCVMCHSYHTSRLAPALAVNIRRRQG
ncbi:MAG: cytochrome c3 family protein [Sphingomonadales bacterium]|nr:cytochrome c3 family protein [Sphingomonadales bacterium]